MSNPASVPDLEARWRTLTGDERSNASAALADAWALLEARLPGLDARVTAGDTSVDVARAVVCAMVLRALRNPEGKRSESIDDYSWTLDGAVSSGSLYVSDAEAQALAWGSSSGVGSVRLVADW